MSNYETICEEFPDNIWKHPSYYAGHSPDGDICVYSRSRDSDITGNVNYERILEDLVKLWEGMSEDSRYDSDGEPTLYDFRAGHWAVGWVEYIIVSKEAPEELLDAVSTILEDLDSYPVYDESAVSEAEMEAVHNYWENASYRERCEIFDRPDLTENPYEGMESEELLALAEAFEQRENYLLNHLTLPSLFTVTEGERSAMEMQLEALRLDMEKVQNPDWEYPFKGLHEMDDKTYDRVYELVVYS